MMKEEPLRVAIPNIVPWFILVDEGNVTRLEGTAKGMLDYVSETLRRPIVLMETFESGLGNEIEPGNWTGSLGMVQRGEADVVLGMHYATEESYQLFGYTSTVFETNFGILSGPPIKYEKMVGSLLSSVSLDVWIALTITWIVVSTLSYLMSEVERSWFEKNVKKESLSKTMFAFWGLLFERGFDYLPSSNYRRLVLAVWLILCEVLMSGIGGNLSSKMAIKDIPQRVDSIQDILNNPNICPYIPEGVFLEGILKDSANELYQKLWERIESCNGLRSLYELFYEETLELVNQGSVVIMANADFFIPEIVSSSCRQKITPYYLGKETFASTTLMMIHRKDLESPLVALYRRSASVLMQASGMRAVTMSNSRSTAPCYAEAFLPIPLSALSLSDLAKVFQLWLAGLAISSVILIAEISFKVYKKR